MAIARDRRLPRPRRPSKHTPTANQTTTETKHSKFMKIGCSQDDLYVREKDLLGFRDLWPLVSLEDFRCFLMVPLIAAGICINLYKLLLLRAARSTINSTSFQLFIAFVAANLLFLLVNAWMIAQQFWPLIPEKDTAEFFVVDQYDGGFFSSSVTVSLRSARCG
ncbi:hypothetical protein M3Y99_00080400 [Aphelenchoides fujianensis]|nr:hypothetical protein M3Y99_00080400 [Aphelenchoides fujianensis]